MSFSILCGVVIVVVALPVAVFVVFSLLLVLCFLLAASEIYVYNLHAKIKNCIFMTRARRGEKEEEDKQCFLFVLLVFCFVGCNQIKYCCNVARPAKVSLICQTSAT